MLKGVDETLLCSRKCDEKCDGQKSRKIISHSPELKALKNIRANNSLLHLNYQFTTNESLVTRKEFDYIRNYFIAEIFILNGQRSLVLS